MRKSSISRLFFMNHLTWLLAFSLLLVGQLGHLQLYAGERANRAPASATPDVAKGDRTDAERIATIRQLLVEDREQQTKLQTELEKLEADFQRTSDKFSEIDAKRTDQRAQLTKITDETERRQLTEDLADTEKSWQKTRDHFDLIIRQRKAVQQQLDTLKDKIVIEEKGLEQLSSTRPNATELPAAPKTEAEKKAASPKAPETPTTTSLIPGLPATKPPTPSTDEPAKQEAAEDAATDPQMVDAKRNLASKQAALSAAKQRAALLDQAVEVFERDLKSAHQLLDTLNQQIEANQKTLTDANRRLSTDQLTEEERTDLEADRDRARKTLENAQAEVAKQKSRLAESEETLKHMQQSVKGRVAEITGAEGEVQSAQNRIAFLKSPVAPHQLRTWISKKGPHVLLMAVLTVFLWWFVRLLVGRIITGIVGRYKRASDLERNSRAETLRRVIQNAASIVIIVVGSLAILNEAGLNVTVLLGGAAVIGAAIAFGSQNLIKDYFAGFMILIENQYGVGNVVRIGGIVGSVEDISLRITVLRDEEGIVHFVPHSQVNVVSNLTYGWSRAVFKIRVAYDQDIEQASAVLLGLARELKDDTVFGPQVLGEPEMLGVESFDQAGVVIKFLVKTRPLRQWAVKRELLRRIKKRFDKLGIVGPATAGSLP